MIDQSAAKVFVLLMEQENESWVIPISKRLCRANGCSRRINIITVNIRGIGPGEGSRRRAPVAQHHTCLRHVRIRG